MRRWSLLLVLAVSVTATAQAPRNARIRRVSSMSSMSTSSMRTGVATDSSPLGRGALRTRSASVMATEVATPRRSVADGEPTRLRVQLTQVGRGRWQTPSGLELTRRTLRDIQSQTRPRDNANESPTFRGDRGRAVAIVDQAFQRARRGVGIVSDQTTQGRRTVVVQMQSPVGFLAGRLWQSRPALRYMRLTLQGNELVSASPTTRPNRVLELGGRWRRPNAPESIPRGGYERMLRRIGLGNAEVETVTTHARLGLPSRARPGQAGDHLSVNTRGGFVASYHNDAGVPNWVGYAVRSGDVTPSLRRINNWRPDRTLPNGFRRFRADDHIIDGYDIGHLVQSAARKSSLGANQETFLLSMNAPQSPNNNRGPWRHMEEHIRGEARAGNTVHVYTGPAFTGARRTVGEGGAAIPDSFWKVAVIQPPNTELGARTRVIAINIPNDDAQVSQGEAYGRYRVSVGEIEEMTGLRFFTNLPSDVAGRMRGVVDDGEIPSLRQLDRGAQQAANANPGNPGNPGRVRHRGYSSVDEDPAARGFDARARELGFNPNNGRFQPEVANMGTRLEQTQGLQLRRTAPGEPGTWVDARTNRSYAALGGDSSEGRFDVRGYQRQLGRNLERANHVVFDPRVFHAPANAQRARSVIDELPAEQRARVVLLE